MAKQYMYKRSIFNLIVVAKSIPYYIFFDVNHKNFYAIFPIATSVREIIQCVELDKKKACALSSKFPPNKSTLICHSVCIFSLPFLCVQLRLLLLFCFFFFFHSILMLRCDFFFEKDSHA